MARKSRRNNTTVAPAIGMSRVFNAAIYARLSVEDKGGSLENQISLLQQYISNQPDLQLRAVFKDSGQTGTNFARPGFAAMMDTAKKKEIDCIVIKDLSRFGRNYIETGNYLENIFPFLGIRFISVNDNYDNQNPKISTDNLTVWLKNLIKAS